MRKSTFGDKVAATRGALRISQTEAALAAGVGRNTWARIELDGDPSEIRPTHDRVSDWLLGRPAKQSLRWPLAKWLRLALAHHDLGKGRRSA